MKFCGKHFACHFARKRMRQVHHMLFVLAGPSAYCYYCYSCQALPPPFNCHLVALPLARPASLDTPLWQRHFGALIRCSKNGSLWKMICIYICMYVNVNLCVCVCVCAHSSCRLTAYVCVCVSVACHTFFVRLLIEKCWLHEKPPRLCCTVVPNHICVNDVFADLMLNNYFERKSWSE